MKSPPGKMKLKTRNHPMKTKLKLTTKTTRRRTPKKKKKKKMPPLPKEEEEEKATRQTMTMALEKPLDDVACEE